MWEVEYDLFEPAKSTRRNPHSYRYVAGFKCRASGYVFRYFMKGKKAKDLRQTVLPTHLQRVKDLINKGRLEVAGSVLDDDGEMIGSMLVVDFRNRRALDAYLKREPYVTEGVWKNIRVTPMNRVV